MTSRMYFASLLIIFYCVSIVSLYRGTKFPVKYLTPEDVVPTTADLVHYLRGTKKILNSMTETTLNKTDPNQAISLFFMRAILKRTLQDYGTKIQEKHSKYVRNLLNAADNLMSHFFYALRKRTWSDVLKRAGELFRDDSLQVRTLGKFNTNRLTKWILSDGKINKYAQAMDEATLPKEEYVELVHAVDSNNYSLSIDDSDYCLSKIIFNKIHWDLKMRQCGASKRCTKILYRSPSVAYSTSHRMLNLVMARQVRRCYMRSREKDYDLLNNLCASMYRETVYLARRGYFYKDMFLEHIALCSLLGYKEFHRQHWFRKVVSWIDKDGCITENNNFEINRTIYLIKKETSKKKRRRIRRRAKELMEDPCHSHQMGLALVTLAHGIRHAVHFG